MISARFRAFSPTAERISTQNLPQIPHGLGYALFASDRGWTEGMKAVEPSGEAFQSSQTDGRRFSLARIKAVSETRREGFPDVCLAIENVAEF